MRVDAVVASSAGLFKVRIFIDEYREIDAWLAPLNVEYGEFRCV